MGHQLLLYIQPVYNYDNKTIEYAEILIRKYRGIEGAERIMKFVKRSKCYEVFDLDILKETLYILKSIPDLGYPVGVNICSKSLEIEGFAEKIVQTINESGVPKEKVIIEVNEYTNFSNAKAMDNLGVLHDADIKLALDDFGIGNTNVLTFINTKFAYLKIDKQLIDSDDNWNHKKFVLGHMKEICDTLHIKTVVEGIETDEQLVKLRDLGYNTIQGYVVTRPVSFLEYIEESSK